MDIKKLYYEDCHLRSFSATVQQCTPAEKGYAVTLDATAFYPEGGGQACDLGTLNGIPVLHVQEQGEQVVHLCAEALNPGTKVEGVIDWNRRFHLMQQHTGEHIVSGIIHKHWGYHNVGFHMGADVTTIDFDGLIPPEAIAQIEQEANAAVWANLPVVCRYPDPEELATLPYRTKRKLDWPVRIVEIPGIDLCACCGVHTACTGEIGLIKIFSCVKFRQGVRLEMACGGRALEYLGQVFEQNRLVSQAFSAKILETGTAAKKMNELLAAEKYRATALQRQLFDRIAVQYEGRGNVLRIEQGLAPGEVRELAERISAVCGGTAAVFSGEDGRFDVCLACPGVDIRPLGKALSDALHGRGGGKTGFFQGSVQASQEQIEAFFSGRQETGLWFS